MKDVTQIDRNLQPDAVSDGLWYFDVRKSPFRLYGLYRPRDPGPFRRCPEEVARAMSAGALFLHTNTSGARVRFRTDSRIVAIRAEFPSLCVMPHQALGGSSCFCLRGLRSLRGLHGFFRFLAAALFCRSRRNGSSCSRLAGLGGFRLLLSGEFAGRFF